MFQGRTHDSQSTATKVGKAHKYNTDRSAQPQSANAIIVHASVYASYILNKMHADCRDLVMCDFWIHFWGCDPWRAAVHLTSCTTFTFFFLDVMICSRCILPFLEHDHLDVRCSFHTSVSWNACMCMLHHDDHQPLTPHLGQVGKYRLCLVSPSVQANSAEQVERWPDGVPKFRWHCTVVNPIRVALCSGRWSFITITNRCCSRCESFDPCNPQNTCHLPASAPWWW